TVYAGDFTGAFHALTSSGHHLWSTQVTTAWITASALVLGERIIVGDNAGFIYGLDRHTGAVAWTINPNPHPHAAIWGSATKVGRYAAIGVASDEEAAAANPSYPCCSFRGSLVLLDPRDGRVVWQTYMISDSDHAAGSAGAGVWSTPTYDRESRTLYITTG